MSRWCLAILAPFLVAPLASGSRIAFPHTGVSNIAAFAAGGVSPPAAASAAVWRHQRAAAEGPLLPPPAATVAARERAVGRHSGRGSRLPKPLRATNNFFADLEGLRTLLAHVDDRVRCVLLIWAFVDNVLRSLQVAMELRSSRLMQKVLGQQYGADIYAMEMMQDMLTQADISGEGDESEEARRLREEGIRELEARIEDRAGEAAEYALEISADTTQYFDDADNTVVRITDDEVCMDLDGDGTSDCEMFGEYVDLSGESLRAAATIDVSEELGVTPMANSPKVSLLGLVTAVSHPKIFDEVMKKVTKEMHPKTLDKFVQEQGAENVAELVRMTLSKYRMPEPMARARTALYGMTQLQDDPTYWQVAWGFRLAARTVKGALARLPLPAHLFADIVLRATPFVEVFMRTGALVNMLGSLLLNPVVTPRDHLKAVTTFLTVMLICQKQASSQLFGRVADQAWTKLEKILGKVTHFSYVVPMHSIGPYSGLRLGPLSHKYLYKSNRGVGDHASLHPMIG